MRFPPRVVALVVGCLVVDLYGYAVYRAFEAHVIGPVVAVALFSVLVVIALAGLAVAPSWIERGNAAATPAGAPSETTSLPPERAWWRWMAPPVAVLAGAAIDWWGRTFEPARHPGWSDVLLPIGINALCIWFGIFTVRRLRRLEAARPNPVVFRTGVRRFGVAVWAVMTINMAMRMVGGPTVDHIVSGRFAYELVQIGAINLPFFLWGGYLWGRIMSAIFLPPRR